MKKILIAITILLTITTWANDNQNNDEINVYLKDFISIVSSDMDMTIVISDDIEETFSLMIPKDIDGTTSLRVLLAVLEKNELIIETYKEFFLISKLSEDEIKEEKLQSIQLKNVPYSVIKDLFNTKETYKPQYIASSKTVVYMATDKDHKLIKVLFKTLDKDSKQLKLKISIIDTNINKLIEHGTQITTNFNFSTTSNFFFNLFAYPFQVNSQLDASQSTNLNLFLKFLNQHDISQIVSSPTVTLYDNRVTEFNVVKTIPFVSGTTTSDNEKTTTTSSYDYKDVGLKIKILPTIFKDKVEMDLSIISESILDSSDRPTTSKSSLSQTFKMKKDVIYVLTGINQTQNLMDVSAVPVLSNIPLIDWLFKYEKVDKTTSNLTLVMQLIEDSNKTFISNEKLKLPTLTKKVEPQIKEHQRRVNEILGLE